MTNPDKRKAREFESCVIVSKDDWESIKKWTLSLPCDPSSNCQVCDKKDFFDSVERRGEYKKQITFTLDEVIGVLDQDSIDKLKEYLESR